MRRLKWWISQAVVKFYSPPVSFLSWFSDRSHTRSSSPSSLSTSALRAECAAGTSFRVFSARGEFSRSRYSSRASFLSLITLKNRARAIIKRRPRPQKWAAKMEMWWCSITPSNFIIVSSRDCCRYWQRSTWSSRILTRLSQKLIRRFCRKSSRSFSNRDMLDFNCALKQYCVISWMSLRLIQTYLRIFSKTSKMQFKRSYRPKQVT